MREIKQTDLFGFRVFFSRIGYLAAGSLLKFFVQLAIVILYAHKLSLTEYGIYQFIWMYVNFFSVLGLFGVTTLMLSTPLTSLALWIRDNKKFILFAFTALNGFAACFLVLYGTYFTGYQNILLVALLFLQNLSLLAESISLKEEQEKKVFYSNLIYISIYAFIHFYLLYNTYSVTALLHFVLIAAFFKCAFLIYRFKLKDRGIRKYNDVGKQWFLLGINDVLGILVKWIDKWLILFFLPPAGFAVYFNGTYEIPVFMIILGAIGSVSIVDFSKIKEDHGSAVKLLFHKTSLIMAAIVFPALWFFFFYADVFILTFFGTKYTESIPVFKISVLILPVRIIYSTTVLQVYNRTDLIVKGSVLDLILAVLLMWILYPVWGMQGLAAAFVISTFVQVGYYLFHTGKLTGEKMSGLLPFRMLGFLILTCGILVGLSSYPAHLLTGQYCLLTGVAIAGAVVFMSLYFLRAKITSL